MPGADDSLPLPPTPAEDGRPHIYVINSSEEFLETIAEVLTDVQLHVTVEQMRPNVEVTLANLRSARPDLVILDVTPFPEASRHLLDALAASDDLPELPVMLGSTNPRLADQLANQYPSLVRDVLPKPFDLDELYVKLRRLVGAPVL